MFRKLVILWTLFAVSLAAPQFGSGGAGGFGNSFGGFGGNNDGFGAGLVDGIGAGIEDGIGAGFGDGIGGIGGGIGGIGGELGTGLGAGFGTGLNTGLGTTFGTAFRNNVRSGLGAASVSSQSINFGGGLNSGFGGISEIPSFGSPITSGIFSTASHHEKYPHKHPKYKFKYAVHDHHTGDQKSHEEARDGDRVRGMYSLVEPDGTIRRVEYTADDKNGFNAVVTRTGHAAHPPPQPHHHVKAVLPVLHSYH